MGEIFFDWTNMGELQLFRVVLRLRGMKKFFELGQKNIFPKFDPLTAPGIALCVNLGPKCQNLFPLVSD